MKKLTMCLFILFGLILSTVPAMAANCGPGAGHGCTDGLTACRQIEGLTEAQTTKMQKMYIECKKNCISLMAEVEKNKLDLKGMCLGEPDPKKMNAKIDQIKKLEAECLKQCVSYHIAVRNMLTKEQRASYKIMFCGQQKDCHKTAAKCTPVPAHECKKMGDAKCCKKGHAKGKCCKKDGKGKCCKKTADAKDGKGKCCKKKVADAKDGKGKCCKKKVAAAGDGKCKTAVRKCHTAEKG